MLSRTRTASSVTSGPMPSPGKMVSLRSIGARFYFGSGVLCFGIARRCARHPCFGNRSGNAPDPSLRLKDSSARDDASRNWQDSQVFPDTPVFLNTPQIVFLLTVMFGNGSQGQCRAV